MTVGNHQFTFLMCSYSVAEIGYLVKKRNEIDKNTNFMMKNNKKSPRNHMKALSKNFFMNSPY